MNQAAKESRSLLLEAATRIMDMLESEPNNSLLRTREYPLHPERTTTGGWRAEIGDLDKAGPYIEVWLDRFTGSESDRLYVGFVANSARDIRPLINTVPQRWRPTRVIATSDIAYRGKVRLKQPLDRECYGTTLQETHLGGETYFGFYDPVDSADPIALSRFSLLAITFLLDVAHAFVSIRELSPADDKEYAQIEPQKVRLHKQHDRHHGMASRCKRRDNYSCRVCGFRFSDDYGGLGKGFAEAHHTKPLSRLKPDERTYLKDMVTVCSNCHRMLHRMTGTPSDVTQLSRIVAQRRAVK